MSKSSKFLCKYGIKAGFYNRPFFFVVLILMLNACSILDLEGSRKRLFAKALNDGWVKQILKGEQFKFLTLGKGTRETLGNSSLRFYIEGDGYAWINRNIISPDPSPHKPLGLRLALSDTGTNIIYIGRPCQYLTSQQLRNCHPKYWSISRYSNEVVDALNVAIDNFKNKMGDAPIELIGYSGGGTLAALIADRRTDVKNLITVAGNLDIDEWTKHHKVTQLSRSLNPAIDQTKLNTISQHHFWGTDDQIVPAKIIYSYLEKIGLPKAENTTSLIGFTHTCCWHKEWVKMLKYLLNNKKDINLSYQ